jgi:hypothetical protein
MHTARATASRIGARGLCIRESPLTVGRIICSVGGTSNFSFVLMRVPAPLLRVLQVFGDCPPRSGPDRADPRRSDRSVPTEPPQKPGAESASDRRLCERDKSLVFQRPIGLFDFRDG